ncbi:MAG: GRRM system radical SAM/SPASM domain protein [Proteobacteria bacterium]|nr:GRRM system radical SAM/SPASM domain protein [Pseudomonadota bacterium]
MTPSSTFELSATHAPDNVELAPLGLLVLQPTTFCNIDCSYCYLSHRAENNRMDGATVRAIARFLRGMPLREPQLSVVWHAGEPLTAPIDFYEAAFEALQSGAAPMRFRHHFQTNGMLITDAWCELIKQWSVHVGVSIDGPKAIHDAHRVDRSKRGTFERVMRGVSKLREHDIPFTVIGVLTRNALHAPDDVWRFFETLGATQVALNVEEAEGINASSSLSQDDGGESFRAFIQRIAKLRGANPSIRLREFDGMRGHLTAPPGADVMRADNLPGAIINIDLAGNVTTFSPELLGVEHDRYGKFHWGNVHTDDWQAIIAHPGFRRAYGDILAGIAQCRESCAYFSVCGGGNPSNKLAELGTFAGTETQYCRLHVQAFADLVIEDLEHEIGVS